MLVLRPALICDDVHLPEIARDGGRKGTKEECMSVFADSQIARVFFLFKTPNAALPIYKIRAPREQVEHPPWRGHMPL
jgi:hypothetical protein